MKNIFISLSPNPPNGFDYRMPAKRDLLGRRVALFADSLDTAFALLDDFSERVYGVVITVGDRFVHCSIGAELWHLIMPAEMLPNMYATASCFLDIMSHGQTALDANAHLRIELARSREIRKQIRKSYNENTERLGNKIEDLWKAIEKRKQAEEKLAQEHTLLRTLIDHLPDYIFVKNIESQFMVNNTAHLRILKATTQDDLIGKTDFNIFPQELAAQYYADEQEVIRSGLPLMNREEFTIDSEGRTQWLLTTKAPLRDSQGKIVGLVGISRDISERKQAEETLRRNEASLLEAQRIAHIGNWWHDVMTGEVYWSDEMFRIAERERQQVTYEWLYSIIHPDDLPCMQAALKASRMGQQSTDVDFRIVRPNGEIRHIHDRWESFFNDAGKEIRRVGTIQDITERKQAEKELRLNESRLETLLTLGQMASDSLQRITDYALEEAIRLTDSTIGYLAFMNEDETALVMHSWSKIAMEGCRIKDRPIVYPIEGLGLWGEALRQRKPIITNDYTAPSLFKKGQPEGHVRLIRHMNIPVFDGDRIVAVAGVGNKAGEYGKADVRQLTLLMEGMWTLVQRKQAEEELCYLRNYLSNIIDSMPSVLIGVDSDGTVTQWNTEARRATGVSMEDAVGQPLARAFPRLAAEMERVREAMQTREVRSDPRQARREDGEVRYEDVTIYPLIANGVEGAVIRVDDVTERVRIEEIMIQSEKMLSVGGLAAGMAHEINNPLGGMMQTASVMSARLTNADLPANQRAAEEAGTSMEAIAAFMESRKIIRMLGNIRESGCRAAEIVQNMLSFARKSDAAFSTYNLADLLDQTVDLAGSDYDLKKNFDFRQIEIVREYEADLPDVPCDASKIQQVFLNILRNGAYAMHAENEELRMKNEELRKLSFILRLAYEQPVGRVRIEIADNGPGMDKATRKRVFEPFFTTKPVGVGTGLGLSVSYFIITENHGGDMSVESTPGEGTTFIISLPVEGRPL